MDDPAIGRGGPLRAAIAGRRSGLPAERPVTDVTALDLVAIHTIAARPVGVAGWAFGQNRHLAAGAAVVHLPIGFEVPVTIAHAAAHGWPCAIKRQARGLSRRAADRPVGGRT